MLQHLYNIAKHKSINMYNQYDIRKKSINAVEKGVSMSDFKLKKIGIVGNKLYRIRS